MPSKKRGGSLDDVVESGGILLAGSPMPSKKRGGSLDDVVESGGILLAGSLRAPPRDLNP